MTNMTIALSEAKARLSEVIRKVRQTGESVTITVDGEAAVVIHPAPRKLRKLTPDEVAIDQALAAAARRLSADEPAFDVIELFEDLRR